MRIDSFKNYLKMHNSEDIKDRINFKMIEDIKDMALEYIDMGFSLHIDIFFRSSDLHIIPICFVSFSHDKSELKYEKIICVEDNIKFVDINYRILLLPHIKYFDQKYIRELIKELKSRISEAYPKEIIC